jgi:hypothetical protein
MKKTGLIIFFGMLVQLLLAQDKLSYAIPSMPNEAARKAELEQEWAALQFTPPRIGVRDCFLFVLDALDTKFITTDKIEWVLKLVKQRVITDAAAGRAYGSIYWGWTETGYDAGDGNNVEFCVQYGILVKLLFNDQLSPGARKTLDEIFEAALTGIRNQPIRISYTNIYVMRIWNLIALGQAYNKPSVIEEGRVVFNKWLNHITHYGNREYDSPTYCGVDIESLLLIYTFSKDADIKSKASDALNFLLTDLSSHYIRQAGLLGGAHSRDYNRIFSRDLLEEKYFNPLLGRENNNTHLFNQICADALQKLGLSAKQKELMNRKQKFIIQRWDSLPNTYACDFTGNKVSIASSNQAYSPDDKPFIIYMSSPRIPEMPNIVYDMEGRDDHYGTWSAEGMGEKMKQRMPANYPKDGGWNKTRHLMPFLQSAQNKNEFVMLAVGEKDHNCINPYLNSTIILPDVFDELWMGNHKIDKPAVAASHSFDESNTFFARFEDVAIAFKILWDDAGGAKASLYNDGYKFEPNREKFVLKHNSVLRITLRHPDNGKAAIAMWWKVAEGIKTSADFEKFRNKVLLAPVSVQQKDGIAAISVTTDAGKLGVMAAIVQKKRLDYYNPVPMPADFLFMVDGKELGKPILEKYW